MITRLLAPFVFLSFVTPAFAADLEDEVPPSTPTMKLPPPSPGEINDAVDQLQKEKTPPSATPRFSKGALMTPKPVDEKPHGMGTPFPQSKKKKAAKHAPAKKKPGKKAPAKKKKKH